MINFCDCKCEMISGKRLSLIGKKKHEGNLDLTYSDSRKYPSRKLKPSKLCVN